MTHAKKSFSLSTLKRAETFILVTIVLFVGLVFLGGVLAGWEDVMSAVTRLSWHTMAGVIFLSLCNFALRGFRWYVFARTLKIDVSLRRIVLYYVSGFALITTPGKVGTILRAWFLNQNHSVKYSRATPMLLMDYFTDLVAMVSLIFLGLITLRTDKETAVIIFAALLVIGFMVFTRPRILHCLIKYIYKLLGKPKKKFFAWAQRAVRITQGLFALKPLSFTAILSIIGWAVECAAFYVLLAGLGSPLPFSTCVFIFCFSTLVGAATMLPGGLGGAEVSMYGLLVANGVAPENAVAATAIIRLCTLWLAVGIGFLTLPFGLATVKKN